MFCKFAFWASENAASIISNTITILGFAIATLTVAWQLRKQHRLSLELQRKNAEDVLLLKVHEILVARVRDATQAIASAMSSVNTLTFKFENFNWQKGIGLKPAPVDARVEKIRELNFAMSKEKNLLLSEFESWGIVFPDTDVFQVALNAAHHDVQEAFQALLKELWSVLPIDAADGTVLPPQKSDLSTAELERLQLLTADYTDALDELGSYVFDLGVESQNALLSGVFNRTVSPRRPLDQKHKVISTSPLEKQSLMNYFENESEWGKNKKRILSTAAE